MRPTASAWACQSAPSSGEREPGMAEPTFTAPETDAIDDEWDEPVCERCNDDGMDPQNDYLLPCPACQGEQQP